MIAVVIDMGWQNYYAQSPYFNLLRSSTPGVLVFVVDGNPKVSDPAANEAIRGCDAIVTSAGLERFFADYEDGPRLSIGDDMHRFDSTGLESLREEVRSCDYYLTAYSLSRTQTDHPYLYLSGWEQRRKLIFYPHCAPAHVQTSPPAHLNSQAAISGEISLVYPIRQKMLEYGGPMVHRIEWKSKVREDYFQELSHWRIGLTCNSWLDYTVAKYYEIPFVGSLLMAPLAFDSLERELLGFRDGENMIAIDDQDFSGDSSSSSNPFRRKLHMAFEMAQDSIVAEAGQALVRSRHTVDSRLRYILGLVDRIRRGGFTLDDQFGIFRQASDLTPAAESESF